MQDLIHQICGKTGISKEQAMGALETVKKFAKEKMPMMAGSIDSLFATTTTTDTTMVADPAAPAAPHESVLDKISDYIPGETGQKVEDFAKNAADKAEDVFDSVKDKLGDMFGGDKK